MEGKFSRSDKRITVQFRSQRERIRTDRKRERNKVKGSERKRTWVIIPVLGRVQKPAQKSTQMLAAKLGFVLKVTNRI